MTKPSTSGTLPVASKEDDQNFEIDINKVASDYLDPIDKIRSLSAFNRDVLSSITPTSNLSKLLNSLKIEKTAQESRCHAFYRLVGFPVVGEGGGTFYNPGFDIVNCMHKTVDLGTKIAIAKKPLQGFAALSEARENFYKADLSIFSNTNSIDASVLALSSGGTQKLRDFIAPLAKDASPFDGLNSEVQSYTVDTTALSGVNKKVPNLVTITKFLDQDGVSPTKFGSKRFHIIKPFVVDARIDFIIQPQANLVAVPFVANNSFTKVSATENVNRPLLEKIIRDRITIQNDTSTAGSFVDKVLSYIKDVPAIKDDALINLVRSKKLYKSDQDKFIDNVNTIRTMMAKLVDSQNIIKKVQGLYYYVPSPSTTGPEGGSTVQGVFLPTTDNPNLNNLLTSIDKEIIKAAARSATKNLNKDISTDTSSNDPLSFSIGTTFGPDTSDALGDNNTTNQETLSQTRTRLMTKANDALRTIEIIMGEFSGLGLCDIVAIIGALNIMDIENVVGFLDDGAYERMKGSVPGGDKVGRATLTVAMTDLTSRVKDFYNLMDKIYKDIASHAGVS